MYFRTNGFIILSSVLLALVSTACSRATVAITPTPAGPHEAPISLPYPGEPAQLGLVSTLPGMIRLAGYNSSDFVSGTVQVSNREWIPQTETTGGRVSMVQTAITEPVNSRDLTNLWKLRVGDSQPFRLEIHNGQAEGHWNLSGLPITDLYAELGEAKNAFTFDEPNPTVMQKCELHCETGEVVVEGILNAVCLRMVVEAGSGSLTLRFAGKEILQDLKAAIHAGTGTTSITLSPDTPSRITVAGGGHVIRGEGVIKLDSDGNNSVYETPSYSRRGTQSKTLEISISGGSGAIYLNRPPS